MPMQQAHFLDADEDTAEDIYAFYEDIIPQGEDRKAAHLMCNMPQEFGHAMKLSPPTSANRTIIPDPYKEYLRNLPSDRIPNRLTVAKESSAIHSILPLIDNQARIKCIINP